MAEMADCELTDSGEKENSKEEQIIYDTNEEKTDFEDTKCGIFTFQPKWLQIMASKKIYIVAHALACFQQVVMSSYFAGTLTTMEKNFSLTSRESGMMNGAIEFGYLLGNIIFTYVAAKVHRPRLVAIGFLVIGISSFTRLIPHLTYGAGENMKIHTNENEYYLQFNNTKMSNFTGFNTLNANDKCDIENGSPETLSYYIFVISQVIIGFAQSVYWTCGATYLDDNIRKILVPGILSFIQIIKYVGISAGFLLSSYTLQIYVDSSSTPTITTDDPRWIGAWWLGWYPIGIFAILLAAIIAPFPRTLPRAAARRKNTNSNPSTERTTRISFSDFITSFKRMLSNKIVVLNSFAMVFSILSNSAHWTFLPKYMESQFRFSPGTANFVSATAGMLCSAPGVLTAGIVLLKFKPSARLLFGWAATSQILQIFGFISFIFMSCEEQTYHGHWNSDHIWNLTEACNVKYDCGTDIPFSPVCDITTGIAYYSACHAGCNSSVMNNAVEYTECACVSGLGKVINGVCPTNCTFNAILFVSVLAILKFISGTGRIATTLIQFRCVEEEDKSLSIGSSEIIGTLFASIPSPMLYGLMIDWTCIVWGDNCGETGNCWLYDGPRLRLAFNLVTAAFLLTASVFDGFVWYYIKDLKIYDEPFEDVMKNENKK